MLCMRATQWFSPPRSKPARLASSKMGHACQQIGAEWVIAGYRRYPTCGISPASAPFRNPARSPPHGLETRGCRDGLSAVGCYLSILPASTVLPLAFSPGGRSLYSLGQGLTRRAYCLPSAWLDALCQWALRAVSDKGVIGEHIPAMAHKP